MSVCRNFSIYGSLFPSRRIVVPSGTTSTSAGPITESPRSPVASWASSLKWTLNRLSFPMLDPWSSTAGRALSRSIWDKAPGSDWTSWSNPKNSHKIWFHNRNYRGNAQIFQDHKPLGFWLEMVEQKLFSLQIILFGILPLWCEGYLKPLVVWTVMFVKVWNVQSCTTTLIWSVLLVHIWSKDIFGHILYP